MSFIVFAGLSVTLSTISMKLGSRYLVDRLSLLKLVSWSLTSLFSTNMAISETNGHSL